MAEANQADLVGQPASPKAANLGTEQPEPRSDAGGRSMQKEFSCFSRVSGMTVGGGVLRVSQSELHILPSGISAQKPHHIPISEILQVTRVDKWGIFSMGVSILTRDNHYEISLFVGSAESAYCLIRDLWIAFKTPPPSLTKPSQSDSSSTPQSSQSSDQGDSPNVTEPAPSTASQPVGAPAPNVNDAQSPSTPATTPSHDATPVPALDKGTLGGQLFPQATAGDMMREEGALQATSAILAGSAGAKGVEPTPVSQAVRNTEVLSGWLGKRGRIVPSWKQRFFRLTHFALSYYVTDDPKESPINVVPVQTMRDCSIESEFKELGGVFAFRLFTNDSQYLIAAEESNERAAWVTKLRLLIANTPGTAVWSVSVLRVMDEANYEPQVLQIDESERVVRLLSAQGQVVTAFHFASLRASSGVDPTTRALSIIVYPLLVGNRPTTRDEGKSETEIGLIVPAISNARRLDIVLQGLLSHRNGYMFEAHHRAQLQIIYQCKVDHRLRGYGAWQSRWITLSLDGTLLIYLKREASYPIAAMSMIGCSHIRFDASSLHIVFDTAMPPFSIRFPSNTDMRERFVSSIDRVQRAHVTSPTSLSTPRGEKLVDLLNLGAHLVAPDSEDESGVTSIAPSSVGWITPRSGLASGVQPPLNHLVPSLLLGSMIGTSASSLQACNDAQQPKGSNNPTRMENAEAMASGQGLGGSGAVAMDSGPREQPEEIENHIEAELTSPVSDAVDEQWPATKKGRRRFMPSLLRSPRMAGSSGRAAHRLHGGTPAPSQVPAQKV